MNISSNEHKKDNSSTNNSSNPSPASSPSKKTGVSQGTAMSKSSSNGTNSLSFAERQSFKLYCLSDYRLVVESPYLNLPDATLSSQILVVHSEFLSVKDFKLISKDAILKTFDIHCVLGILEMSFAKYMVVATKRKLVATLQSHKIWKIVECQILPIGFPLEQDSNFISQLDENDAAKYILDMEYLSYIRNVVNSGHLYYSTTYDLTLSLQHSQILAASKVGGVSANSAASSRATTIDSRYFFNEFLQKPFLHPTFNQDLSPWICKCILGFSASIDIPVNLPQGSMTDIHRFYTVTLISRVSTRRLGTRYVRRGLNADGFAANNVEMEQLVFNRDFLCDNTISSFVQIRGSAPAIWTQEIDLSYRPKLAVADIHKPVYWDSIKKHYLDLKSQYIAEPFLVGKNFEDLGKVICVNLLDDQGFEGPLTETYEESVKIMRDPKIHYESFPINKWCKKMNFRNMDILVARFKSRLHDANVFLARGEVPTSTYRGSLKVSKLQTGVLRVSCLDSLDRTNLTCSLFARHMLPYQLNCLNQSVSLVSEGIQVNPIEYYSSTVKRHVSLLTNLWADSGDSISIIYAGTRALKADVTRTGKRQMLKGSVDDGLNSLTRYYLNNFADGRKQDSYDILTGQVLLNQIFADLQEEAKHKANSLAQPVLNKERGVGWFLPGFVVDQVEPLIQVAISFGKSVKEKTLSTASSHTNLAAATTKTRVTTTSGGHVDVHGKPKSYVGLLIAAVKIYAPERISTLFEFVNAMVVFAYILVMVRIFHVEGKSLVDRPKMNGFEVVHHEELD